MILADRVLCRLPTLLSHRHDIHGVHLSSHTSKPVPFQSRDSFLLRFTFIYTEGILSPRPIPSNCLSTKRCAPSAHRCRGHDFQTISCTTSVFRFTTSLLVKVNLNATKLSPILLRISAFWLFSSNKPTGSCGQLIFNCLFPNF